MATVDAKGLLGAQVPELLRGLVSGAAFDVVVLLRGGGRLEGRVAHADAEVVWLRAGERAMAVRAAEIQAVELPASALGRPEPVAAEPPSNPAPTPVPTPSRATAETLPMEQPAPVRRRAAAASNPPRTRPSHGGEGPVEPIRVQAAWLRHLQRPVDLVLDLRPADAAEQKQLDRVLSHLAPAVLEVRRNLLDVVERVIVSHTEQPGIDRVEGDLWVGVNLPAGRAGRWTSTSSMVEALEAALQS